MALTAPSTTVAPFDSGYLAAGITASATTITISPITKTVNGVNVKQGFDTTAGLAIISQGDYFERISFEGASVDATTKVTTLTTVTRGLSVTSTSASFSGGTGRIWRKGANIAVVADASYFQSGAFKNVANTWTATQTFSAPVIINGTTSYIKLPSMTEAQRNALTASNGMAVYVTDGSNANRIHTYEGGAWGVSSSTTVADGSTTVAGKFEEATVAEQGTATATGSTGARLVVANANLVKTSSGAGDENKIPLLQADGALHINHIATGTPDGTKFVRDDGVLATPSFTSTDYNKVLAIGTTDGSSVGSSSTSKTDLITIATLTTAQMASGTTFRLRASGDGTLASGNFNMYVSVGSVDVWFESLGFSSVSGSPWFLDCDFTIRTAGASADVYSIANFMWGSSNTSGTIYRMFFQRTSTPDTTASQTLKIKIKFDTSNASNSIRVRTYSLERLSTTAS